MKIAGTLIFILLVTFVLGGCFSERDNYSDEDVVANSALQDDFFGASVSLSGDWLATNRKAESGEHAVVVYRREGDSWIKKQLLPIEGPRSIGLWPFNGALLLRGTLLLVGVQDDNGGIADIWRLKEGRWEKEARLRTDPAIPKLLIDDLAIEESDFTKVAIAATFVETGKKHQDYVFVFERSQDSWKEFGRYHREWNSQLAPPIASIAFSDNKLFVGSPSDAANGTDRGAILVFNASDQNFHLLYRIQPSVPAKVRLFGDAMAVTNEYLYALGMLSDQADTPAYLGDSRWGAFRFKRVEDGWEQSEEPFDPRELGPDAHLVEGAIVARGEFAAFSVARDEIELQTADLTLVHYHPEGGRKVTSLQLKELFESGDDRARRTLDLSENYAVIGNVWREAAMNNTRNVIVVARVHDGKLVSDQELP